MANLRARLFQPLCAPSPADDALAVPRVLLKNADGRFSSVAAPAYVKGWYSRRRHRARLNRRLKAFAPRTVEVRRHLGLTGIAPFSSASIQNACPFSEWTTSCSSIAFRRPHGTRRGDIDLAKIAETGLGRPRSAPPDVRRPARATSAEL